jgi:hypothetical protein
VSAIIKMADVKKQRICIKFCFKLNKTVAETHRMLKEVFGEQALGQARTFEWFKRFKDGQDSVDDRRPSACTTPETFAKVREVILQDRRQILHHVCNRVGLPKGNVNAFYRMNGEWLLHHANAPAHTSLVVWEFLTKKHYFLPCLLT